MTNILQHLEILLKIDGQGTPDFLLIDDDHINNVIASKIIARLYPGAHVKMFTCPQGAIDYILTEYQAPPDTKTILLLDIDMPVINGWGVLDRLMRLPDEKKERLVIHILTSSLSNEDKEKASHYPLVSSFISKPLRTQNLLHGI